VCETQWSFFKVSAESRNVTTGYQRFEVFDVKAGVLSAKHLLAEKPLRDEFYGVK
jgi:hypothetical protein